MTDIILSTQNGEPVASSRDVAKRFGKRHDHVIRDIEELIKGFPKNGDTPMFFKTEYSHPQNHQKYPMYLMNRDGFSMLAMGFTGKEAVQWKLKYIEAFNQMEKQLSAQHKSQRAVQDANIQSASLLNRTYRGRQLYGPILCYGWKGNNIQPMNKDVQTEMLDRLKGTEVRV